MQCSSCGHQNPPDARFCDRCGAPLSQGGQVGEMQPQQAQFGTQNTSPGGPGWQSPMVNQPSSATMPQQSMPVQPTPPIPAASHGGIPGIARNIQMRTEPRGRAAINILTFLLEEYDTTTGNRTRAVPVEMRGDSIRGVIIDGNWVEVMGKEKDGLLQTKLIYNLSTASIVKTKFLLFG